ncbi:hypothetical protein SAMN05428984_2554 [Sphingomonas sp. OK281]|nr:hypothetical protein SAMN05428984_2554 [Sphingomonas sp. OK281]
MMSAVLRYLGVPNWAPAFAGVVLVKGGQWQTAVVGSRVRFSSPAIALP